MKLIDPYLAALVAGDLEAVPLAAEIRTVETLRQIRHGMGLWATATASMRSRRWASSSRTTRRLA
ncbi:MAG TPA: hypothetical protein VF223_26355 [Trebonia sp.]